MKPVGTVAVPKAILFDFDGVIVDSEAIHHRAYDLALEPLGIEGIPFEAYAEHFSNRGDGLAWAERTWPGVRGHELKRRKEELFLPLLQREAALRPGAAAAVEAFGARWPIAVATGSARAAAQHVLGRFGLARRFGAVVAREDYARDKPAPDAFLRAAERLGVPPGDCVAIEDSMKGLAASKAAGIPCIVVPNEYTRSGRFEGAAAMLESMEALTVEAVERVFDRIR